MAACLCRHIVQASCLSLLGDAKRQCFKGRTGWTWGVRATSTVAASLRAWTSATRHGHRKSASRTTRTLATSAAAPAPRAAQAWEFIADSSAGISKDIGGKPCGDDHGDGIGIGGISSGSTDVVEYGCADAKSDEAMAIGCGGDRGYHTDCGKECAWSAATRELRAASNDGGLHRALTRETGLTIRARRARACMRAHIGCRCSALQHTQTHTHTCTHKHWSAPHDSSAGSR